MAAMTETVEEALKNPNSIIFQLFMNDLLFALGRNEIITEKLVLQTLQIMREEGILQRQELIDKLQNENRIKSAAFAEAVTQQTKETKQLLERAESSQIQEQINKLELEIKTIDTRITAIKQLNKTQLRESNDNFISIVEKYLDYTRAEKEKMQKGLARIPTPDEVLEKRPDLAESAEQYVNAIVERIPLAQELVALFCKITDEKDEGIQSESYSQRIFDDLKKMKEARKELIAHSKQHIVENLGSAVTTVGLFKDRKATTENIEKLKEAQEMQHHKKLGLTR